MTELYIEEIYNSLCCGHAAVLIGAGFSRNADPANATVRLMMPMWDQLADQFCDKLGIDESHRKYLSTLSVAQQIEEAYSRPFLDSMIRDAMSDSSYNPSDIHVYLMKLPWTDVFTTNYDTLLERACKSVPERSYEVIRDQNDLIYSAGSPRIIKLHGSFPSNTPFIITEEDFRTYPRKFAPFVNTVQQSMLENTFCLMGFSGDDPNFLKWIGWVNDNLGDNAPIVYLITYKHYARAKENDLLKKHIQVVALEDVDAYTQAMDKTATDPHREIIGIFLRDLSDKYTHEKNKRNEWPGSSCNCDQLESKKAKEISKELVHLHDTYPGWLVVPYRKHSQVAGIIASIEAIYRDRKYFRNDKKEDVPPQLMIDLIYEYCWLHNIIGRPLSAYFADQINGYISDYEKVDSGNKSQILEKKKRYILISLLRERRADGEVSKWEATHKKLIAETLDTDEQNSALYEEILKDIYQLKFSKIVYKANKIVITDNLPEWALRKASLLAMGGRYSQACDIVKDALEKIRYVYTDRQLKSTERNLSIESCLVALYNYIAQVMEFDGRKNSKEEKYTYTISNGAESEFVWNNENEHYSDALGSNYIYIPDTYIHPNYEIGSRSTSTTIGRSTKDYNLAREFILFREITGIPFRISNVVFKAGVEGAAKRLAPYSIIFPVILSVLVEDKNIIKNIWSRSYIESLPQEAIDALTDSCIASMSDAINLSGIKKASIIEQSIQEFPLDVVPYVLDVLCTRCSSFQFGSMLWVLPQLYQNRERIQLHDFKPYIHGLINCMPLKQLISSMDIFWDLPLLTEKLYQKNHFLECFGMVYDRFVSIWNEEDSEANHSRLNLTENGKSALEKLFIDCKDKNFHRSAIMRLTYVSEIFHLSDSDRMKLSALILSPDNTEYGVPYLGDFSQSALRLFTDSTNNKQSDAINHTTWESLIQGLNEISGSDSVSDYSVPLKNVILYIEENTITKVQADAIISNIQKLCKKLIQAIQKDRTFFDEFLSGSFKNSLILSGRLAGEAIISAGLIDNDKGYISDDLNSIQSILTDNSIPCSLLNYCMTVKYRSDGLINDMLCGRKEYTKDVIQTLYTLNQQGYPVDDNISGVAINALRTALGPEIIPYIGWLEYLIRQDKLSSDKIDELDRALPGLYAISQFEDTDSDEVIASRMILREVVSNMSHTIYKKQRKSDKSITPGVQFWKDAVEKQTEFAEIRNCWDELEV